jgi:glycosyltransferase involved in cell wall biosynthesis
MAHWHETTGVELHVVRRKVDSAAPFEFADEQTGIKFYPREELDREGLKSLARELKPGLIVCFGWMDQDYLSVARTRSRDCPAVMTMDNQWLGTARQHLGVFWSRLRLRSLFDYVWVPGPRQHRFARRLGFPDDRIRDGLYVANATNFDPIWQGLKTTGPTKRLVFTGRYAPAKGLSTLWEAFIAYHDLHDSALELWCIGTGALFSEKPEHPKIKHLGFVQPSEFSERLEGGGVFILPSTFEPWGLVVQEFALAGFPLVLSQNVGAADVFLGADNGLLLPAVNRDALIEVIAGIDALTDRELAAMSRASRTRAERLSAANWARQASAFMERRA